MTWTILLQWILHIWITPHNYFILSLLCVGESGKFNKLKNIVRNFGFKTGGLENKHFIHPWQTFTYKFSKVHLTILVHLNKETNIIRDTYLCKL